MSVPEVLQSFLGHLQDSASAKSVFGEPISAEGKTIIPVAKVGYGWGGGFHPGADDAAQQEAGMKRMGFGGGVGAKAVGVIEVSKEGTRFVPIAIGRKILGAAAAGLLLGMLIGRRR